jgi:shikimate dehydrogenase
MTERKKAPAACLIGWPAAHSRSPLIHHYWLRTLGIEGGYLIEAVPPDEFQDFVFRLSLRGFVGANVTIPHKERALALSAPDDRARAVGAANTLWFQDGELRSTNTDVEGFINNLDAAAPGWDQATDALVLGAGGSARAVIYALRQAGAAEVRVWNRTHERAQAIARELGAVAVERAEPADIVVNCTSVGLSHPGDTFKALPVRADDLGAGRLVVDMVYRLGGTPLLHAARAAGAEVVDGLEVLVAQGAASLERWTGRTVPDQAMREAVEDIAT